MFLRCFFGTAILAAGWFPSFEGEDISIHKTNDSILLEGEEIYCDNCSALVLGHRLNINQATQEELEELPRIGAKKALAIIELREKKQGFSALQELDEVRGIGLKTVAELEPYLRIQ